MAFEILSGTAPPGRCTYLPEETDRLEYRYYEELPAPEYEELLARGWRRQGICLFRPGCPACDKCRSLRVDIADFKPSKSQRRCRNRNRDVRLVVRRAGLSRTHIALFNAYHADMHERRGWPFDETTPSEYAQSFLGGNFPYASEFVYLRGREVLGIGLVDITEQSLSSVYFYHHPKWRPDGPGTFSLLTEIEFARRTGRRWLYLGYWIAENRSMAYKNRYRPHEILQRYVGDDETPRWARPESGNPE